MQYLTAEEILVLHSEIIDATGGSHGVRDAGLLLSIAEKPKAAFDGKELYHGVYAKAAVYLESLTRFHVFVDGNKRTAIAASARFLFLNGFALTATNKEVEDFVSRVATKKFDVEAVAAWFKRHTKKRE